MSSDADRLGELEGWRKLVERKHDLTTVVAFVEELMDVADYKARFLNERQRRWRRWRTRVVVLGLVIGIVTSTVNATMSLIGH